MWQTSQLVYYRCLISSCSLQHCVPLSRCCGGNALIYFMLLYFPIQQHQAYFVVVPLLMFPMLQIREYPIYYHAIFFFSPVLLLVHSVFLYFVMLLKIIVFPLDFLRSGIYPTKCSRMPLLYVYCVDHVSFF